MKSFLSVTNFITLAALGFLSSGCAIAGYAAKVVGGPPTPAQYVPANKPLVVMVKDAPDPTGMRVESESIAADIEQQITDFKIAPVISADHVMDFHTRHPGEFSTMTPAAIGRAVGADQVLYVEIVGSSRDTEATNDMLRGRIAGFVKIIDTKTGETLFPTDGDQGLLVNFQTPLKRLGDNTSPLTVDQSLHAGFADKIVRMFRPSKDED